MEDSKVQNPPIEDIKPKKKGNGCLIAFLIVFILLALLVGGAYLGYKKILKGLNTPSDLGVTYSMADLEESFANAGFTGDMCLDCTTPVYSKPHEVEVTFTSSQASAWINYANHDLPYGKLDDMQVKFSDGKAEISALFEYEGKEYPVYVSGTGGKASSNSITGQLESLKVAGVSLPAYLVPVVESALLELANGKLANMGDTLRIDTLEITEDGLEFDGLAPSVMK